MDGNGVSRFPEGSGRQGRVERYCCNVICGAPTTSKVKGLFQRGFVGFWPRRKSLFASGCPYVQLVETTPMVLTRNFCALHYQRGSSGGSWMVVKMYCSSEAALICICLYELAVYQRRINSEKYM